MTKTYKPISPVNFRALTKNDKFGASRATSKGEKRKHTGVDLYPVGGGKE